MTHTTYGQLGANWYDAVGQGQSVAGSPVEFVMNGVTYRVENGKAYRKQNGQLIPVTNQQELNALDDYYSNTVYQSNVGGLVHGYVKETINGVTYGYPAGQRPNNLPPAESGLGGIGVAGLVGGLILLYLLTR